METEELVRKTLESFDAEQVARLMKQLGWKWFVVGVGGDRVPTAKHIRNTSRVVLRELLGSSPETVSISIGGLVATRRGSRLGIAFVPVQSEEFP